MRTQIILLLAIILSLISAPLMARAFDYQLINLENVSRYTEDRIAYQQIELTTRDFLDLPLTDSSVASLLIIKDKKMYLIKDGYDDVNDLKVQKAFLEIQDKVVGDMSLNKINGKPNFIRITERRVEVLKKVDLKDGEDFVNKNFGKFYANVRNALLEKHVAIFRSLMIGRKESGLYVDRVRIPRKLLLGSVEEPFKFATYVTAKADDEKIYYAEDADGDGITETFCVSIGDGFTWGFKSGPNIIFIYKNTQEDIKKIIGNLTKEAAFGTSEEAEVLKTNMDEEFRKSMHSRSVQGKNWDDTENIQRWLQDIIYESNISKKTR